MPRRHSQHLLRLTTVTAIAVALSVLVLQDSANAEVNLSVEATAGYTNNLLRASEGDDEFPVLLGLTGAWTENTRRLSADVEGRVDGITYLNGSFDDEILGALDGSMTWWALPDRLSFVLENVYGQIGTDAFTPISPANRQNTNFLSTGPDWYIAAGERTSAYVGARYETVWYEEVDSDNQRLMATAGVDRALSATSHFGLGMSSESVDFESEVQSDFNRHEAYVRYAYSREQQREANLAPLSSRARSAREGGRQSGVTVNAGYTWLTGDVGTSSLPFLEVTLSRPISPSVTMGLGFASRFYDAGREFASASLPGGGSAVDTGVIPEGGVYEERSGSGSIAFQRQRTRLAIVVRIADEMYEEADLDRRRFDGRIEIERRMIRRLIGSADVRWARYEYEPGSLDSAYTDTEYRLQLRRELGRRTSLSIVGQFSSRSSDDPVSDYDETRGYLVINYSLR